MPISCDIATPKRYELGIVIVDNALSSVGWPGGCVADVGLSSG
jgi:hypothetical protein